MTKEELKKVFNALENIMSENAFGTVTINKKIYGMIKERYLNDK